MPNRRMVFVVQERRLAKPRASSFGRQELQAEHTSESASVARDVRRHVGSRHFTTNYLLRARTGVSCRSAGSPSYAPVTPATISCGGEVSRPAAATVKSHKGIQ
jgi:hypothetical protein